MSQTEQADREALSVEPGGRWWPACPVLLTVQLLLTLPLLNNVPRFYNDEAWEASLGHSLATEGVLRHPIIEGWGGMHVRFVQNQVVLPLVCSPLFRVFGCSVLTGRLASVLISLLAVTSIFAVMRRWFGPRAAFLITLATMLHPWFFEVSRRCRPEIYYIALAMTALAMGLGAMETAGRGRTLFAGMLAGLACLAHPTGAALILAIAAGVLPMAPRRHLVRLVGWAAAGIAIVVLPYGLYVLWAVQHPEVSFFEQMQGAKEAGVGGLAGWLANERYRWGHFFQWPYGAPLCVIMLIAWGAAWLRPRRPDRVAAIIILVFALIIPLASVNRTSRYLIALVPFLAALLVRLIARLGPPAWGLERDGRVPGFTGETPVPHRTSTGGLPGPHSAARALLAIAIGGIYFTSSLGAIGLMCYRLADADVYRLCDRVSAITGRDARIYGRMLLWIGGDRYRYGPFPLDHRWRTTFAMLKPHHYDYAVRTAWDFSSSGGVSRPPTSMPAFRDGDSVDGVCRWYGERIAAFRDPDFGPVEIYRLDWSRPVPDDVVTAWYGR